MIEKTTSRCPKIYMKKSVSYDLMTSSRILQTKYLKVFSLIKTSVASDERIGNSMKRCWQENKYLIDPHTACAVTYYYDVIDKWVDDTIKDHVILCRLFRMSDEIEDVSYLCVSTADAAKFPEILEKVQLPIPRSEKIEKFCKKKERFCNFC